MLGDLQVMAPAMRALLALTGDFDKRLPGREGAAERYGFLRPGALRRADCCAARTGRPRSLAEQVARRYREIMVDEYQDTNEVQNCIFRAVSRQGAESLRRGRREAEHLPVPAGGPHDLPGKIPVLCPTADSCAGGPAAEGAAEPELPLPPGGAGRLRTFVFAAFMSREMGEMDYGRGASSCTSARSTTRRVPTARRSSTSSGCGGHARRSGSDRAEAEARFVAQRIRPHAGRGLSLSRGEDGTLRPCSAGGYRDSDALPRQPG